MKQLFFMLFGVMAFIVVIGYVTQKVKRGEDIFSFRKPISVKKEIKINNTTVSVDVASTEEARKKGLGGKSSLGENEGMLFVFGKNVIPKFWMKDVLIPIDIIWIKDEVVVQISKNVQIQPNAPDNALILYSPSTPINYVLEVNAGFSDKNKVKAGDKIDLSRI